MRPFSFLLAFFILLAVAPVHAQTITETQQLSFGNIVLIDNNAVGQITINSGGGYSINSNIYLIEDPEIGMYDITGGPPNSTYTVTFTLPTITISRSGINFIIDNFVTDPATLSTDGAGEDSFRVGARLRSQTGLPYADGIYNGSFDMTVNF